MDYPQPHGKNVPHLYFRPLGAELQKACWNHLYIAPDEEGIRLVGSVPSLENLNPELMHHVQDVKLVLDMIRIVCINVEAQYAYCLANHLPRAAEAKMNIKNLLQSPGKVTVGRKAVHVYLQPAGSTVEQQAYEAFYEGINDCGLTMPADHPSRLLQFHPHPG